MSTSLRFAIICEDERAELLADVLRTVGEVYRRRLADGAWEWTVRTEGDWGDPPADFPKSFDALFFHTGAGDPSGIPNDIGFAREFAFSSGGTGAEVRNIRADAIPIGREFPKDECPIEARHLEELEAFVRGPDRPIPSFCALPPVAPSLAALAILCQLYAVAGVAAEALPSEDGLAARVGLDRIGPERLARMRESFAGQWPELKKRSYWRVALGLKDGTDFDEPEARRFVERVLADLGEEHSGETEALVARLREGPAARALKLLTDDPVEPSSVEAAYDDLSGLLARR